MMCFDVTMLPPSTSGCGGDNIFDVVNYYLDN